MTIHVNIGEAKTRLSQLIAAAKRGEEVVITRAGVPDVRLVAVDEAARLAEVAEKRRGFFGIWKGKVDESVDWLAPMSEEELAEWYDSPIFPPEEDDEAAA